MGRSFTPKYAVEMEGCTSATWRVGPEYQIPGNGKPTAANLAKYVEAYIGSLKTGGVNVHISKALGYMPIPNWARIVLNDGSRTVIAEWKAPLFMIV